MIIILLQTEKQIIIVTQRESKKRREREGKLEEWKIESERGKTMGHR